MGRRGDSRELGLAVVGVRSALALLVLRPETLSR